MYQHPYSFTHITICSNAITIIIQISAQNPPKIIKSLSYKGFRNSSGRISKKDASKYQIQLLACFYGKKSPEKASCFVKTIEFN